MERVCTLYIKKHIRIPINKNTSEATGIPEGTVCVFRPYLMMRTVDGSFVPWVASHTDLIEEDWSEVVF